MCWCGVCSTRQFYCLRVQERHAGSSSLCCARHKHTLSVRGACWTSPERIGSHLSLVFTVRVVSVGVWTCSLHPRTEYHFEFDIPAQATPGAYVMQLICTCHTQHVAPRRRRCPLVCMCDADVALPSADMTRRVCACFLAVGLGSGCTTLWNNVGLLSADYTG